MAQVLTSKKNLHIQTFTEEDENPAFEGDREPDFFENRPIDNTGLKEERLIISKLEHIKNQEEHRKQEYLVTGSSIDASIPIFVGSPMDPKYRPIDTGNPLITDEFLLSNSDIFEKKSPLSLNGSEVMISRPSAFGGSLIRSEITNISNRNIFGSAEADSIYLKSGPGIKEVAENFEQTISSEPHRNFKEDANKSIDMSGIDRERPDLNQSTN